MNPALKSAAECAYRPRSLNAPLCAGDSTAELGDTIGGGNLTVDPLAWGEALAAAREVDAEAVGLLARRGEGETTALLAAELGLQPSALNKRLLEARRRLRQLPEVAAVMLAA